METNRHRYAKDEYSRVLKELVDCEVDPDVILLAHLLADSYLAPQKAVSLNKSNLTQERTIGDLELKIPSYKGKLFSDLEYLRESKLLRYMYVANNINSIKLELFPDRIRKFITYMVKHEMITVRRRAKK